LVGGVGSRREARERALTLLYEAASRRVSPGEALSGLLIAPSEYVVEVLQGVDSHLTELDAEIGRTAAGWTVERMPVIDLSILRMALWELMYRPDVPATASITEAVELASQFSTDRSAKFVNGVLARLARDLRPDEAPPIVVTEPAPDPTLSPPPAELPDLATVTDETLQPIEPPEPTEARPTPHSSQLSELAEPAEPAELAEGLETTGPSAPTGPRATAEAPIVESAAATPPGPDSAPGETAAAVTPVAWATPFSLPLPPLADPLVTLRPWHLDDAESLAAAWADPAIAAATAVPGDSSVEYARRWIAGDAARLQSGLSVDLVITATVQSDDLTGQVLGEVGFVPSADGSLEMGYWVAAPFRGRGFATHALRLLSKWAQHQYQAPVSADIPIDNPASEAVARNADFLADRSSETLWRLA